MGSVSKRYAPLNRSHIPGFPNSIPKVDWQTYLPKFKDQKGDDVAFHLVKFHMHICSLKVQFHEDCLMKMFMATLEERARSWYEDLPPAGIFSLQDFYSVFCENYKDNHPSLVLVERFCANLENLCQLMGIDEYDEDVLDSEVREALSELSAHHNQEMKGIDFDGQHTIGSSLTDNDMDQDLDAGSHDFSPKTEEIDEKSEQSNLLFDMHDQIDYMDGFPEQPAGDLVTKQLNFQPAMDGKIL